MKLSIRHSLGKIVLGCAYALAVAPLAHASGDGHAIVVPAQAVQGGSIFVMETVIHNVRTGERTVISEECEASGGDAPPTLNCIQANPDPAGMQIYVKSIGY